MNNNIYEDKNGNEKWENEMRRKANFKRTGTCPVLLGLYTNDWFLKKESVTYNTFSRIC